MQYLKAHKHSYCELRSMEALIDWCYDGKRQPSSARRLLLHVYEFHRWLEKTRVHLNPIARFPREDLPKVSRRNSNKKLPDPPTPEVMKKIIESEPDPQCKLVITAAYTLGLRNQEICGLNISDVRTNAVRILGKGDKERLVPYVPTMAKTFITFAATLLEKDKGQDGPLFRTKRGGRITGETVRGIIKSAGERFGIKLHPHLLRHAYATHLIQAGCPIEKMAVLLGHSDISTTWRYSHLTVNQTDTAAHPMNGG